MEKTVYYKDNPISLKASAIILITYKQQFGKEYNEDLSKIKALIDTFASQELISSVISDVSLKLMWCMAKAANNSIIDYDTWKEQFDNEDISELLQEVDNLFKKSIGENDDDISDEEYEPLKCENLVACCSLCGIDLNSLNNMSIGFALNTVKEYINIKYGSNKSEPKARKATQEDYDNF
jgi:hypothetical protein